MRRVFADAVYWIAAANRKDQWHAGVAAMMRSLGPATLVTTEEVLLDKRRPDKGYSLTDCISMEAMRREGITEILTHDVHFTQEGFLILL